MYRAESQTHTGLGGEPTTDIYITYSTGKYTKHWKNKDKISKEIFILVEFKQNFRKYIKPANSDWMVIKEN